MDLVQLVPSPCITRVVRHRLLLLIALVALLWGGALLYDTSTAHAAGTVTDCSQFGPGVGTLQAALVGEGTVTFACDGTINTTSRIEVNGTLVLDATGHNVTIEGNKDHEILRVNPSGNLTVRDLTITGGRALLGGGGIRAEGSLTVERSVIRDNFGWSGAGIDFLGSGTLRIIDSTIRDNATDGSDGAGLAISQRSGPSGTYAPIIIRGTTFSGNKAGTNGGAIHINANGQGTGTGFKVPTVTIVNSTISGNQAFRGGGISVSAPRPNLHAVLHLYGVTIADNLPSARAGIEVNLLDNTSTVQVVAFSTIVADSCSAFVAGAAVPAATFFISGGHNISANDTCNFTRNNDLQNTDPLLGPLADNGGPTLTRLPQAGSPAINAIDAVCSTRSIWDKYFGYVDQRGFGRPAGGTSPGQCDIGAVEVGATFPDHGDAPAGYGTLVSANGPYHTAVGPSLGAQRDGEADGIPTANADGDDLNQSPDDEDALVTPLPALLSTGASVYSLPVFTVQNPTDKTKVYGWIDLNGNGQFDATERRTVSLAAGPSGDVALNWPNLSGLTPGKTYLRLRVSDQPNIGPTGRESLGEVEDYPLDIVAPGTIIITKRTAPKGAPASFSFTDDIAAPNSFTLNDGGTKVFANVAPGTYTVSEATLIGYTLSGLTCADGDINGTPSTSNLGTRTATIHVDPGETVACAFTNSQNDQIIVEKVTIPRSNRDFDFVITDPVGSPTPFSIGPDTLFIDDVAATGTYTISEVNPNPYYDLTGVSCTGGGSSVITDNQVVLNFQSLGGIASHCVFTNTQRSALVIEKQTLPDGDSELFGFAASGPNSATPVIPPMRDGGTYIIANAQPGAWTLFESVPNGWDLSKITCESTRGTSTYTPNVANGQVGVDLAPGDFMRCVFTNSKHEYVTVTKRTVPPGGTGFTFDGQPIAIGDGASFGRELPPGQNATIIENDPTPRGYALTGISCTDNQNNTSYQIDLANRQVDITGAAGLAVNCTYTNTLLGGIVIEKVTLPGTNDKFDFTQDIDASAFFALSNGETQTFGSVPPGLYQVTEVPGGTDYKLGGLVCDDGNSAHPSWGDLAGRTANIRVDPGETVKCTFTNVQNDTIVIKKFTVPSGDTSTDFGFTSNLPGAATFSLTDEQELVITGITPEQDYQITENDPGPGYDLADLTCYNGGSGQILQGDTSARTISLVPFAGDTIYCAFTNQAHGTIVIEKDVLPTSSSETFTFTTNITNPTVFSLGNGDTQTYTNVKPGQYTVEELAGDPLYNLAAITCKDSVKKGGISSGSVISSKATINLDPGETVRCRFLNAESGLVVVEKFTDPPGDTTTTFNFTSNLPSAVAFDLMDQELQVVADVQPDQAYTVTEGSPGAGYDLTDIECLDPLTGAIIPGDVATGAVTFTPTPGEFIYCGFLNTKRGSITIVKTTVPATNNSFEFTVVGDGGPYNRTVNAGSQIVVDNLVPGIYTVTESDPLADGFGLTKLVCVDGDSNGIASQVDIAGGVATVVVDPGENVTCTFTNGEAGRIFVSKLTDPVGDPQPFVYTLLGAKVNQPFTLTHGATPFDSGNLVAGTYSVIESPVAGWAQANATCSDGSTPNSIDLQPGETVTCTFINEDIRGRVIIRKQSVPAGGTDFAYTSGLGNFTLDDGDSQTFMDLVPGVYTITETNPSGAGYELSGLTCVDSSKKGTKSTGNVTSGVATVHLDPSETVTCTFTNTEDDTITVEKVTLPASTTSFNFESDLGDFALANGALKDFTNVTPGSYTISETDPAAEGYVLTSISCEDSATGQTIQGDLNSRSVNLSLVAGERIHCTFENTKLGTVIIRNITAPGGGTGFAYSGDFGDFNLDDGGSQTFTAVQPGSYTVTEADPLGLGYELGGLTCVESNSIGAASSGNVATRTATLNVDPGEMVTCTFTNTEDDTITIEKVTLPASTASFGFGGDLGDFSLTNGQVQEFTNVSPGSYTISEDSPVGATYTLTRIECVDSATGLTVQGDTATRSVQLDLVAGERIHCTFTNEGQTPTGLEPGDQPGAPVRLYLPSLQR